MAWVSNCGNGEYQGHGGPGEGKGVRWMVSEHPGAVSSGLELQWQ